MAAAKFLRGCDCRFDYFLVACGGAVSITGWRPLYSLDLDLYFALAFVLRREAVTLVKTDTIS